MQLNRQALVNPDAVRRFNSACSNGRSCRRSTRGRFLIPHPSESTAGLIQRAGARAARIATGSASGDRHIAHGALTIHARREHGQLFLQDRALACRAFHGCRRPHERLEAMVAFPAYVFKYRHQCWLPMLGGAFFCTRISHSSTGLSSEC